MSFPAIINAFPSPFRSTDAGQSMPPAAVVSPFARDILVVASELPATLTHALLQVARERRWRLATDFLHTHVVPSRWDGDAVLAFAPYAGGLEASLDNLRLPCVTLSFAPDARIEPRVEPDHRAIGQRAARHLLELDCRKFVWAPFNVDSCNSGQLRGFEDVLGGAGYACQVLPPAFRRIGQAWNDNAREWQQAVRDLLSSLRGYTGIFAFNDCLANKLAGAARAAGMAVPGQVAIVGVGNHPLDCESGPLSLTSIDPDLVGMVRRAADVLEQLLAGQPPAPVHVHPPGDVVARESTTGDRLHRTRIHEALAYMEGRQADPQLSVNSVAAKIGISRRQLERDFRAVKGCTVREYIEDMRMDAAARVMLQHPHLKIHAVAEAIGFADSNRFFRKFRKRFGTTPAAFRRQRTLASDQERPQRQAS